jgi:hypothetical protein
VDPGVYDPETIVPAWDLGLRQRNLALLTAPVHPLDTASIRWNARQAAKLIRAVAGYFGLDRYSVSGPGVRGQIWVTYATAPDGF